MLQQKNKLTLQKDFKRISRKGRNISSPILNFKYSKNNTGDPRFAFVISTKVSKKAVKRNEIRRQLRETVRLLIKDDKIRIAVDGIFYAKNDIKDAEHKQIQKTTLFLLNKAGVLK